MTLGSNNDEDQSVADTDEGFHSFAPVVAPSLAVKSRLAPKVVLITCLSSIGGLMFGYDTGVISGVLLLLKRDDAFGYLSSWQLETITSVTSITAILGTIVAAYASDSIGRKRVIAWSCVVFIIAGIVMGLATSYAVLVIGRGLAGVAIGAGSAVVPVYIGEVAPAAKRGTLVTLNSVACTGGQVLAYLGGVAFQHVTHGWRYMFGVSIIPPLIFIAALGLVPESPRYLIAKGEYDKAAKIMHELGCADDEDVETLTGAAATASTGSGITSYEDLDSTSPTCYEDQQDEQRLLCQKQKPSFRDFITHNARPISVSCGLMATQQLCGFNSFMYYSATIFSNIGITNPIETSIIVSLTNLVFTFVAVYYVDRIGRRAMLLRTMVVMILALVVTGYAFMEPLNIKLLLVSCIVFVASYSSALGNVPWQAVEFFAVEYRAMGSMFIANTNWICNAGVAATFLSLVNTITPAGTFLLYAFITSVSYVGLYIWYPEVTGIPLEEVHRIFET